MALYFVKDPSGSPLKGKDLPDHIRDGRVFETTAYWKSKMKAKEVRDYMGGGKLTSVKSGFTVSKEKTE